MKKTPFLYLVFVIWLVMLLPKESEAASSKDTAIGRFELLALEGSLLVNPYLSYEVDQSWKMDTAAFATQTRHIRIHNGQFIMESGHRKLVQNYGFSFSVDSLEKIIEINPRRSAFYILMNFDFTNHQIREQFIEQTLVTDTGSLRKLSVTFKPNAPWATYSVVYNPANYLPQKISFTMANLDTAGLRADHEFLLSFRNYQTSPFDDDVFSNTKYFTLVNGEIKLTEAYGGYKLINNP